MIFGIFFILGFIFSLTIKVHKIAKETNEILIRQRHIHDGLEILLKTFFKIASKMPESKEKAQPEGEGESKPDNVEND